jgi:uncharacterized glyoxalase superfamily protein PhnB
MHAEIRIVIRRSCLSTSRPTGTLGTEVLKGSPVTIHLYVDDVDAVIDQAVRAGGKITMPVEDMFWGTATGSWKTLWSPVVGRDPYS